MYHAKEGTLVDEELKDRLMNKEILAYIASQFVDDFAHMSWKQVLPYLEDPLGGGVSKGDRESSASGHGSVRYDILVRLRSPRGKDKRIGVLLNVEGQNEVRSYEAMKRRMLSYPCRLVSEQKEDVFTSDRYGDLAEVSRSGSSSGRRRRTRGGWWNGAWPAGSCPTWTRATPGGKAD